ncbi:MAG TPA: hypothetical protein VGA56_07575 [Opitutaceae bacterium]
MDEARATTAPAGSPFLSVYEIEEGGAFANPQDEEFIEFVNELQDEEFDEALFELVNEAAALADSRLSYEQPDPMGMNYKIERALEHHFDPLVSEAEAMFAKLATELGHRDVHSLTEEEIETLVDQHRPSVEFNPAFENFWGKLKKTLKKAAGKAVKLARKGVSLAAKLGLGPILYKLRALIKPLLRRVLQAAIRKLPTQVQPYATKLAERLGFLKGTGNTSTAPSGTEAAATTGADAVPAEANAATADVSEIQQKFNEHVASVLFAPSEIEQEMEVAETRTESQPANTFSLADLDNARQQFVEGLGRLHEGEDPTPHVENFLPAILPALKIGIRLAGRKRVVRFLSRLLGKLIKKFVDSQHVPALSQAIVDAGLRLINLEATEDDARSAVAATVEETVHRVAALPDYVLDDQELLEGFAMEAFEQAASANLPPVLPEDTYLKRPDLLEARTVRGAWLAMPWRKKRKRYKKYSRVIRTKVTPHKAAAVETFGGEPLAEFLEEQLGLAPGEDVDANVHLYEAVPGTSLPELSRLEENTPGLGNGVGYEQLHPLTPEAAGILLGEPGLGRAAGARYLANPHTSQVGQRFYYLEIPGKKLLTTPGAGGKPKPRRRTRVQLKLDFRASEIRVCLYLSEVRAQELAVKLRQQAHLGMVVTRLQRILERGLGRALLGSHRRLKVVHSAVVPNQWGTALQRLPSLMPRILLGRLKEWILKALSEQLKQQAQQFISASEEPADGVTLVIAIASPPGFAQLRDALKGKLPSQATLGTPGGTPNVTIKIVPGYANE